jgi:hypothetical protein
VDRRKPREERQAEGASQPFESCDEIQVIAAELSLGFAAIPVFAAGTV